MPQIEGVFSKENTERLSRGLMTSLLIFSPAQRGLEDTKQLPSAVVDHYDGIFHYSWTTRLQRNEVEAEVVKLSGEIGPGNEDSPRHLGRLAEADVYYGQFSNWTPRVAVIDRQPPTRVATELFVATAVGNQGVDIGQVEGLISDFVARRNLIQ